MHQTLPLRIWALIKQISRDMCAEVTQQSTHPRDYMQVNGSMSLRQGYDTPQTGPRHHSDVGMRTHEGNFY